PSVSDGGRTVTIKLRSGVKFNDGTRMDAESVKLSLDRHRTLKGSNRASELAPVEAVEVVDPLTVRLRLKAPYSPLVAQLTDRAGLPGHHHQPAHQDRKAEPTRGSRHPAGQRPAGPGGIRLQHRPRGAESGGVGRPVHAGVHADLSREPLLRQEPEVSRPRCGESQEASSRRGPRRRL